MADRWKRQQIDITDLEFAGKRENMNRRDFLQLSVLNVLFIALDDMNEIFNREQYK